MDGIGGIIGILFWGFLIFGGFGWIIRKFSGGVKATYKTAKGEGSFSDNFQAEVIGMGEFQFRAVKQTKTIENKSQEMFLMQFQGLFPNELINNQLSFLFTIYDNTNPQEGSFILCSVPGFNEGTSPTFQFVEQGLPVMQSEYGWKSWVGIGVAPIEFLKFPKKGNRKLEFQCCITRAGDEITTEHGYVKTGKENIITVYKFELDYNNPNTGYLEIDEERKKVENHIILLCFYISAVDDDINPKEGRIIKLWVKDQIESSPKAHKEETKKRLNENITNAYNAAKSKDLSISKVIQGLNDHATKAEKYEALELALSVMSADGVADQKELDSLDNISKKIGIDPKEYKNLRDKSITTVDVVAEKEETDKSDTVSRKKKLASLIGFDSNQSQNEIHKILTQEFKKWNGRINLKDEKTKKRAEEMLKLIAEARKLFITS